MSLNTMSMNPVAVDFALQALTATAGDDYFISGGTSGVYSGTLNFEMGETMKQFMIGTVADSAYEGNETLRINLSNPSGATLHPTNSTATATILDDDNAPPQALAIDDQFR